MMDKPRIYFLRGYWRVSPFPAAYFDRTYGTTKTWILANDFANYLNKNYASSNPSVARNSQHQREGKQ